MALRTKCSDASQPSASDKPEKLEKKETLYEFLKTQKLLPDDDKNKALENADSKNKLNNWRDFAKIVSAYEEIGEPEMNVLKNSSWAVCQEFLGNLSRKDLKCATKMAGEWLSKIELGSWERRDVSTREILNILRGKFPEL